MHLLLPIEGGMNVSSSSKKRLLVTIQAVDIDDALNGFFHTWLAHAANHFSEITVLGLRVGRYDLPSHVTVIPLRPSGSRSRFTVVWTLWKESWKRRKKYDAVFVRGDPQYVILGTWLWALLGKPVILWYAHYKISRLFIVASWLASRVMASVPEACAYPPAHPMFIGQAIDAERFVPADVPRTGPLRMLIGTSRVQRIKGVLDILHAFTEAGGEEAGASVTIIGPHLEPDYVEDINAYIQHRPSMMWGPESVSYDHVPETLRGFDVMINAYQASLDKAIIEGMMSGLIVVAATSAVRGFLPSDVLWLHAPDHATRVAAIRRILGLSVSEREAIRRRLREVAVQHHSLEAQLERLSTVIQGWC